MNNQSYFNMITKFAKELTEAEKRGGPLPDMFKRLKTQDACATCLQNILPPKKALRCSACKAVIYCSASCAKRGWSVPIMPNQPTHKMLCDDNKRHMERLPQTQAITKLFPWGRVECDGTSNMAIALGRFGLFGTSGCGFWNQRIGPEPHSERASVDLSSSPYATEYQAFVKSFGKTDSRDGKELAGQKHLSDEEGWKLPSELIPYRDFLSAAARPKLVTEFENGVIDWDSWYLWRNLSKESPAALLMSYPLSVYQMVVNCLELTSPNAGQANKRVALELHLLGAEVELNFLPLFSELALLLPYHDIKLVLFGGAVFKLVQEAKKVPGALAAKSPVFSYTAPPECGSGAITIYLNSASETWPAADTARPDALVACNAGLASYREWFPVIYAVHAQHIPFATTEYAEQSAEHQRDAMPSMLRTTCASPRPLGEYKIELNQFQRPGQRGIPMYRVPNVVNGFTLVVYKDKKAQSKLERS